MKAGNAMTQIYLTGYRGLGANPIHYGKQCAAKELTYKEWGI